jgi:hypothetical protein
VVATDALVGGDELTGRPTTDADDDADVDPLGTPAGP